MATKVTNSVELDERGLPIIEHLNFIWVDQEKGHVRVTPDEGYAIYDPGYPWPNMYFLSVDYVKVEYTYVISAVKIDELPEGSEVLSINKEEIK